MGHENFIVFLLSVPILSLMGDIETASASSSDYKELNGHYQELKFVITKSLYRNIYQIKDKLKFKL